METMVQAFSDTGSKSPEIRVIHTTLYDLIAALGAEVGPDEEDVLTVSVIHLLHTHRVTCTGNLRGYRLRAFKARGHTADNVSNRPFMARVLTAPDSEPWLTQ